MFDGSGLSAQGQEKYVYGAVRGILGGDLQAVMSQDTGEVLVDSICSGLLDRATGRAA